MTSYPDLFAALGAPFDNHEIRTRQHGSGRTLTYITARTAMNRLDDVLGPENWWDEFIPNESSVVCRMTIRLPDGSTVTKSDAGGYAGMADQGDDDKSGFSDAFKRTAAKFGVARYLYQDGVPSFVRERCGQGIDSRPPATPAAAPRASQGHPAASPQGDGKPAGPKPGGKPGQGNGQARTEGATPKTGRALFAWTKEQEQRHQVGLLKYLNNWAKLQDFPGRMVDWDADQVAQAYGEAARKLATVPPGRAEAYEEALG
jgi:hypothetical protein